MTTVAGPDPTTKRDRPVHVVPGNALQVIEGLTGQHSEVFMTAVNTGTPTGAPQIWKDATGALAIEAELIGTLTASKEVIIGWSETADDEAAVISAINAALTAAATPDGSEHTEVRTITANTLGESTGRIYPVAGGTIKTVVAKTDDASGINYVLRLVKAA